MNNVLIPTNRGLREVPLDTIIRIEANSNYCKVFFTNEYPLTVAKVLQWFEKNLPAHSFYRIHRGHIVNFRFIATISKNSMVRLSNGEELQVSKRKKTAFRKLVA